MTTRLSKEETYLVHNGIMELAFNQLNQWGKHDLANKLQKMAQNEDDAFLLHTLIQTTLDIAYLDIETES